MSSYSFSHQFYQRWTCAPDPIRAAIIQELTDITTLLQHDTPFETFVFSNHDLDAHLDDLYENHEAEQAIAKAIADKQAQEQAAAEKQRLEEERLEQEKVEAEEKRKEEAKLKEEAEAAQKEQQKNTNAADDDVKANTDKKTNPSIAVENDSNKSSNNKNTAADNKPIDEPSNTVNDNNIKTVIDKAVSTTAINLSLKDTKLGASQPELIRELEMHIDDYLSEQMMQISENLKSWLRAELTQHLPEPDSTMKDAATNNSEKDTIKKIFISYQK